MKTNSKNITIIGTGAYGTVLANVLSDNDHNVIMYGIEETEIIDINERNINSRFFNDLKINNSIQATNNLEYAIQDVEYLILSVPVVVQKSIINKLNQVLKHPVVLINVAKGLDPETQEILSTSIQENFKAELLQAYGGIYGPSIAKEVLLRQPTCVMAVAQDIRIAEEIAQLFNNEYFITIPDDDVIGCEYGVALKNSIAIASGIFHGLYPSDNSKASLITLGLNEIKTYAMAKGAQLKTFLNYAGLGDLILTATSHSSRNFSLGLEIAYADEAEKVLKMHTKTIEGVLTCQNVVIDARKNNISLPLFEALYEILFNNRKPSAVFNNILTSAKTNAQ